MCDTFVYIPTRKNGPIIFGKNSDREPNEAQQMVRYPANFREKDTIKATFIEVKQPKETFEVILSKPFQMFGAEMGCNEFGVTIGNEAVFTKIPFDKKNIGLTGMDILRLSLEISKTAKEALENCIYYLEKYGQDACGGYSDKKFYYHNSFLIADKTEAYVLETAGKHWTFKRITGYRAISNGLSIEADYDGISENAIAFAKQKGWTKKQQNFNFKTAYSQYWMPKLAACEYRRNNSEQMGNAITDFSTKDAFQVLRSHGNTNFSPHKANTKSICMHAYGLFTPHQTVGSMVVELQKDNPTTIWITGTSAPCLSLFKPFYFGNELLSENNFKTASAVADESYWWQWEKMHRQLLKNYSANLATLKKEQSALENLWQKQNKILVEENWNLINAKLVSQKAIQQSILYREKIRALIFETNIDKTSFLYRNFWKRQNIRAKLL